MTSAFDVDLEMGYTSEKHLEGATMRVLTTSDTTPDHAVEEPGLDGDDFVDDGYYGGPQAAASCPTQDNAKSVDGAVVPTGQSYVDSGKMWNLYPTKSKNYGGVMFKSWKGYIESTLLFACLFSVTVSLFIIENYRLSPDPNEQTVALLNQLSHQLVGISRGAPLGLPPSPNPIPFRPNPPAVRAGILWFLSLGLNITCAILAILSQQWWRRYIDLLGQSSELHRRARVRAYIFAGTGYSGMDHMVEAIWVLLHTSILFFFIGLVDFLLPINKIVAWVLLGYIVPFALVYIATMLLPYFFPDSHYFTLSFAESWKMST